MSYDISNLPEVTNVNFADKHFIESFNNQDSRDYENIRETLILFATCHSIFAHERNGDLIYDVFQQNYTYLRLPLKMNLHLLILLNLLE